MCSRPENVNHVTSTSQKRPLSIISEQDGDDHDVNNTKSHQAADICCRETYLAFKQNLQPRKETKHDLTKHKFPESKRSHKTKKGHTKSSQKDSKTKQIGSVDLASRSKSELGIYQNCLTTSSLQLDSGNETLKCSSPLNSENTEINSQDDISSTEQIEVTTSMEVTNTQSYTSKQQCQGQLCSSPVQTDETTCGDNTRVTSLLHSNTSDEFKDDERAEEDTDQTSSAGSLHSFRTQNPELVQHLWANASSSRNIHIKDTTMPCTPEITLTLTEEEHSLATLPISCNQITDDIVNKTSKISTDVITSKDVCSNNSSSHSLTNRTCQCSTLKRVKLGVHFPGRTKAIESRGALLGSDLNEVHVSGLESQEDTLPMTHLLDFRKLKETTEKLHLSTRRPSTMLWKQQYIEGQGLPEIRPGLNGDVTDDLLTVERKERIDGALEWLRSELQEMRSQDQNLARQLLTIRQEIHQLKLKRSTDEHQELIEDFQSELDDLQEFSDVLDFPQTIYGNNPLKHIGVTRLNMSARRFSAC